VPTPGVSALAGHGRHGELPGADLYVPTGHTCKAIQTQRKQRCAQRDIPGLVQLRSGLGRTAAILARAGVARGALVAQTLRARCHGLADGGTVDRAGFALAAADL